jgi:peptidoglycan/xylan/chitin deacetylase (PgdA/CDA1 family)
LGLLAYHVAILKGTDVNQPRNLAKSTKLDLTTFKRRVLVYGSGSQRRRLQDCGAGHTTREMSFRSAVLKSNVRRMNTIFKKEIKTALGWAADAIGISARRNAAALTIVAFHRVNDEIPEDGVTCSAAKFEDFCRYFSARFNVITLREQIAGSRLGQDMGGSLSITFDDGYLDNFHVAAPILQKYRLPATFFVTTAYLGTSFVAPWDATLPTAATRWMDWTHVRWLASRGFEIGSHSDTHLNMGTSNSKDIRNDLLASKEKLVREVGVTAQLFAYPFGGKKDISEVARAIVQDLGFECCASCHGGINSPSADPYRLNRIGIAEWFATPQQFGLELLLGKA